MLTNSLNVVIIPSDYNSADLTFCPPPPPV